MLGATNKSRFVVNAFCCEPVRVGRFASAEARFLPVGHSKTDVDRMFASGTTTTKQEDYFNHLYVFAHGHVTLLVTLFFLKHPERFDRQSRHHNPLLGS